jgi:hypothetical protein
VEKKKSEQVHPKMVDFSINMDQKSVNWSQIIPLFTILWDHKPKAKGENRKALNYPTDLPGVLVLSILVRFHDEATTGDYGDDTDDQFHIAAGADEHPQKDHNDQKSYSEKGACRKSDGPRDTRAPRADAKPAGPDRRTETAERR